MYSRISIRNFRGIESLDASGFRRINLIMGRNNWGKTTFLEGLLLLGGATDPLLPETLGLLRGQRSDDRDLEAAWRPLFHNLEPRIPIEIEAQWAEEPQSRELKIEGKDVPNEMVPHNGSPRGMNGIASVTRDFALGGLVLHARDGAGNTAQTSAILDASSGKVMLSLSSRADVVRTTMLSARSLTNSARDAQQFSTLRKAKQDQELIDALRIIEPRVQAIEVLSEPSGPSIYLDVGLDVLVPLNVCGEGMVRLFSIVLELIASRNGVLLIDEIDNGLHYTVMPKLWMLLDTLSERHNVQIFGTTHNDDIIRSAMEAFVDKDGTLGLLRIDRRGDRHVMVAYSEEAMKGVLEVPFEVRG